MYPITYVRLTFSHYLFVTQKQTGVAALPVLEKSPTCIPPPSMMIGISHMYTLLA